MAAEQVTSPGRELDSQAKALLIARVALDKQAEGVSILDLRALSTVTDFFVVCTAGSGRQLTAIKEHIEHALNERGARVWHTEGVVPSGASSALPGAAPQWVLIDCGEVVVHLLDDAARAFYRLEELWADAPRVAIPSHVHH